MKSSPTLIALALSIFGLSSCQTEPMSGHIAGISSIEQAALEIVQKRTAAYNAHDIDAFIATYADNVRIYEYPDKFLGEGTERMRAIFGPQFAENDGEIIVHRQHALEHTVISDETVTFYGTTEHNIGIYTVKDGLISEVRLVEPEE